MRHQVGQRCSVSRERGGVSARALRRDQNCTTKLPGGQPAWPATTRGSRRVSRSQSWMPHRWNMAHVQRDRTWQPLGGPASEGSRVAAAMAQIQARARAAPAPTVPSPADVFGRCDSGHARRLMFCSCGLRTSLGQENRWKRRVRGERERRGLAHPEAAKESWENARRKAQVEVSPPLTERQGQSRLGRASVHRLSDSRWACRLGCLRHCQLCMPARQSARRDAPWSCERGDM